MWQTWNAYSSPAVISSRNRKTLKHGLDWEWYKASLCSQHSLLQSSFTHIHRCAFFLCIRIFMCPKIHQLRLQFLPQGHFNMQTSWATDPAADLPPGRWSTLYCGLGGQFCFFGWSCGKSPTCSYLQDIAITWTVYLRTGCGTASKTYHPIPIGTKFNCFQCALCSRWMRLTYSLAFVSQSYDSGVSELPSRLEHKQCCRFVQARSPLWTWPLSTVLMHITPKSQLAHLLVPLTAILPTKPSKNTSIISKVFAHFLPTSHCLYFSNVILRTQQWKNTLNEGIK